VIHVIAIVAAKPGKRAELLDLVRANVPLVRAEAGCIEYMPLMDMPQSQASFGDDTFLVVEKWRDEAALARHRTAAHMAAYAEKSRDLVEKRSIHVMQTLPDH
jgi:quinol monooxygenase YgiN